MILKSGFTRLIITKTQQTDSWSHENNYHRKTVTMSFRRFLLVRLNAVPVSARCHFQRLKPVQRSTKQARIDERDIVVRLTLFKLTEVHATPDNDLVCQNIHIEPVSSVFVILNLVNPGFIVCNRTVFSWWCLNWAKYIEFNANCYSFEA
jgi:hypothetical protein